MNIVLRSISLLEGKYTQASEFITVGMDTIYRINEQDAFVKAISTENMAKPFSMNSKASLKRKVGYVNEEASVTRTKFAQMEITNANENEGASGSSVLVACNLPPPL